MDDNSPNEAILRDLGVREIGKAEGRRKSKDPATRNSEGKWGSWWWGHLQL